MKKNTESKGLQTRELTHTLEKTQIALQEELRESGVVLVVPAFRRQISSAVEVGCLTAFRAYCPLIAANKSNTLTWIGIGIGLGWVIKVIKFGFFAVKYIICYPGLLSIS